MGLRGRIVRAVPAADLRRDAGVAVLVHICGGNRGCCAGCRGGGGAAATAGASGNSHGRGRDTGEHASGRFLHSIFPPEVRTPGRSKQCTVREKLNPFRNQVDMQWYLGDVDATHVEAIVSTAVESSRRRH